MPPNYLMPDVIVCIPGIWQIDGYMWSIFTPLRFEPGQLVVTGADIGLEA